MLLKTYPTLNIFGRELKVRIKLKKYNEKDVFLGVISLLDDCLTRTLSLEMFGLNTKLYDDSYISMIENLFVLNFGVLKADITFWWVFKRFDLKDELLPIPTKYKKYMPNYGDEYIESVEQLWDAIKDIKEK